MRIAIKQLGSRCWLFTILFLQLSCGPLPKEGVQWINVSLELNSSPKPQFSRSNTASRQTEFIVVVDEALGFSSDGPSSSQVLDSAIVDLNTATTQVTLPASTGIKLFLYRYQGEHELTVLNQLMADQRLYSGDPDLGVASSIDYGESEVFQVNSDTKSLNLTVYLAPDLSGKLAQTYVQGATVWADRLEAGSSVGNLQLDAGEVSTISEADGSYYLDPPPYENYLIVTQGGTRLNSAGGIVSAGPMLAPVPGFGQNQVNITPLTTLVATEPSLKDYLETLGGWNVDVADPTGIPGGLLKISLAVEAYWTLLCSGIVPLVEDPGNQITAIVQLATELVATDGNSASLDETLASASSAALARVLNDQTLSRELTNSQQNEVQQGLTLVIEELSNISDGDVVIEGDVLADIETATKSAFDQLSSILCGGTENLYFTPVIKSIEMIEVNEGLRIIGKVDDDDPNALQFFWSHNGRNLEAISAANGTSETIYPNFDPTLPQQTFTFHVTGCNPSPITESCNWITGSTKTICEF